MAEEPVRYLYKNSWRCPSSANSLSCAELVDMSLSQAAALTDDTLQEMRERTEQLARIVAALLEHSNTTPQQKADICQLSYWLTHIDTEPT